MPSWEREVHAMTSGGHNTVSIYATRKNKGKKNVTLMSQSTKAHLESLVIYVFTGTKNERMKCKTYHRWCSTQRIGSAIAPDMGLSCRPSYNLKGYTASDYHFDACAVPTE